MTKGEKLRNIANQMQDLANEFQKVSGEDMPEGEYSDDSVVIIANLKDNNEHGHTMLAVNGYNNSITQSFISAFRTDRDLMHSATEAVAFVMTNQMFTHS